MQPKPAIPNDETKTRTHPWPTGQEDTFYRFQDRVQFQIAYRGQSTRFVIDHRGPDFGDLGLSVLSGMQRIFKTNSPVIIYPSSGTGAWEACLLNVLTAGDQVLFYETGQFANLWKQMADRLGIETEFLGGDWRSGIDANRIEQRLRNYGNLRQYVAYTTRQAAELLPIFRRYEKLSILQVILSLLLVDSTFASVS